MWFSKIFRGYESEILAWNELMSDITVVFPAGNNSRDTSTM